MSDVRYLGSRRANQDQTVENQLPSLSSESTGPDRDVFQSAVIKKPVRLLRSRKSERFHLPSSTVETPTTSFSSNVKRHNGTDTLPPLSYHNGPSSGPLWSSEMEILASSSLLSHRWGLPCLTTKQPIEGPTEESRPRSTASCQELDSHTSAGETARSASVARLQHNTLHVQGGDELDQSVRSLDSTEPQVEGREGIVQQPAAENMSEKSPEPEVMEQDPGVSSPTQGDSGAKDKIKKKKSKKSKKDKQETSPMEVSAGDETAADTPTAESSQQKKKKAKKSKKSKTETKAQEGSLDGSNNDKTNITTSKDTPLTDAPKQDKPSKPTTKKSKVESTEPAPVARACVDTKYNRTKSSGQDAGPSESRAGKGRGASASGSDKTSRAGGSGSKGKSTEHSRRGRSKRSHTPVVLKDMTQKEMIETMMMCLVTNQI